MKRTTKKQKAPAATHLLLRCWTVGVLGTIIGAAVNVGVLHVWHLSLHWTALLSFAAGLAAVAALGPLVLYPRRSWQFVRTHGYYFLAAACCLFFITVGLGAEAQSWHFSKTKGNAITYDEISILPNGYYYRLNGVYFINPEHPPLVKDIAALPFNVLRPRQPQPLPKDVLFQDYAQYFWGKTFLFETGNNPTEALIFWARAAVLVANAALIFALFWSLARAWSQRAGFITVFFITTAEVLIGHASLVTVDVMSSLFTMLTLVWVATWLGRWKGGDPTGSALVLSSLFCAGALLSKFSTILLVPVIVLLAAGYAVLARKNLAGRGRRFALALVGLFVLSLVWVVLVYALHVRHMASSDIITQLHHSYDTKRLPQFGLSVLESITHWGVFGRALAEFAHGLLMVNNRIYNGAGAVYFMGHLYGPEGAGPLYFPLLYLTKLQPLFLLVSLVALGGVIWLAVKNKSRHIVQSVVDHPLPVVVGAYAALFAAIAMTSTLQIGLRHIFQVVMATMLLSALAVDYLIGRWRLNARWRRYLPWTAGIVAVLMVGSVLVSFPYYLSYYNVFAGGTRNGYKLAVDSNYDWGQDVKRLAAWQQQNHIQHLRFDLFINPFLPIHYYLGDDAESYDVTTDPPLNSGTYLAVSLNQYELNTHRNLPANHKYNQFDREQVARIGRTIVVYKIR